MSNPLILVTGATGYIGGRLVSRLLERGYRVRVLVRDDKPLSRYAWVDKVEVAVADLTQYETLPAALADVDIAYYLVHSMCYGPNFAERDRLAAHNFIKAGQHLKHVIYLGGLLPQAKTTSHHLASRAEVGQLLRDKLPTTEFRAGPIIGSGSASFEMLRYVTERLPAMITPKWVDTEVQSIAVRDILSYLTETLEKDNPLDIVEVGTTALTFKQMMLKYAELRKLKRLIIKSPFLAPRLAALWIGLVTPISNCLAVPLVRGMLHPLRADTSKAQQEFPNIRPISYEKAVGLALERVNENEIETTWSGAQGSAPKFELTDWEGMISEVRTYHVDAPPTEVYKSFASIGGARGWLVWNNLWKIRGALDSLVGGPGLRRGRRHPIDIYPGEALDFWRVETVEKPRLLRLRAEMKVPGKAWLQWEAIPKGSGTYLVQTALFEPKGFFGYIYWYILYPVHRFIFDDLVKAIADDVDYT